MWRAALLLLMGAVLLAVLAPAAAFAAGSDSAVVTFRRPTLFHNVVLQGTYVIVHDDAAMEVPGKHCTRIYHYENGQVGALVTTFRCQPVSSETARQTNFSVVSGVNVNRVTGFQIAGDEEIHAVP